MKKGAKGNKGQKGQRPYNGQWYDGKGYQQPQSHGYQQNGYSGYSGQPLNPVQPPANGYNTKGKGYGKPSWRNFGEGKKGQLPIANLADYPTEDHNAYSETQDWNYNQDWE
eukprot:6316325-Amphidinium_carterae.1